MKLKNNLIFIMFKYAYHKTALSIALKKKNLEIVKLLLLNPVINENANLV